MLLGDLSFIGQCRYMNGGYRSTFFGPSGITSAYDCELKCLDTTGCIAYAYSESNEICMGYEDGPYTRGNDNSDWTCYIMPGTFTLLIEVVGKIIIKN